jgi:uncharacterized protein YdhG (YjbR/CyaY superfamily)
MVGKAKNVAEYLSSVPAKQRAALQKLRRVIKAAAPGAVEGISYGILVCTYAGKPFAYFGAFKKHCTLFPAGYLSHLHGIYSELKGYELAPSGIHFTPEKPLPEALVRKIVKMKIKQIDMGKK